MTETITVHRGATTNTGARENGPTHTVEGLFAWSNSGRSSSRYTPNSGRQESAQITAQLYVPRGADVQARDRLARANGQGYAVVGHALWGEDFPFDEYGDADLDDWVAFQVVSMTG